MLWRFSGPTLLWARLILTMCPELFLQGGDLMSKENVIFLYFRLDRVWRNHLNTMTEKRDKFGRRAYIFRLGMIVDSNIVSVMSSQASGTLPQYL